MQWKHTIKTHYKNTQKGIIAMPMLKLGDKVGIVGCSNGQPKIYEEKINKLLTVLRELGLEPICSNNLYETYSIFNGEAIDKAKSLMSFYQDSTIKAIFDISGGDLANEVLEYINYEQIREANKPFFGYSDLTTVLNAIYKMTNQRVYLYQIRNVIGKNNIDQFHWIKESLFSDENQLYDFNYKFIQGNHMEGVTIGGNIRCFLKLAGTNYMPDFTDKILFLESYGGEVGVMNAFFYQLKQIGVFNKINGILLGTFTTMEEKKIEPTIEEMLVKIVDNKSLPIAKTSDIGHRNDSKCLIIGERISLKM